MSTVQRLDQIQRVRNGDIPLLCPSDRTPPRDAEEPEDSSGIEARTLDRLVRPLLGCDENELLKNRFLCRGAGLLLVGPTGIGKSSLSMQFMLLFALGRSCFGIEPARPLTSLLIQAENDDGDLAEMRDGVVSGLQLSAEENGEACGRICVYQENAKCGQEFADETVRPLLERHHPDLLWIDPALAYLGGDCNSQEIVSTFLRNKLNPLITEFNCGVVIVHHTNKPYAGNERKHVNNNDYAYSGAGSAEWANWSRAILALRPVANQVFELHAAKRGGKLGWKMPDGLTPAFKKTIAHSKEPGTIFWHEVNPNNLPSSNEANQGEARPGNDTKERIMALVPKDGRISKKDLIKLCSDDKIGVNKARTLIDELCASGELVASSKKRPGIKPEMCLSRAPQAGKASKK